MNPIQFAQQIKHELERVRWNAGAAEPVFGTHGSVAVFAGDATEEQIPGGLPMALVLIDSADVDEDEPTLLTQRITVAVGAEVAGDRMGEHALIGGAARDLGRSAGRGTGEIMGRVREAVGSLTGADGCRVLLSATSTGEPKPLGRGRHVALEQLTLSAVCTSEPSYSPPQRLRHEGGVWKWEGSHCLARFDFAKFRLVRKPGTRPSSNPDDGVSVYEGTATSWTGTSAAGSAYTVFALYDSRGGGQIEGASEPEVGSFRKV